MINRVNDDMDYAKTWEEYKEEFCDKAGNYWIGLNTLHNITTSGSYGLSINMTTTSDEDMWVHYNSIVVDSEADFFKLHVSGFTGGVGVEDWLGNHNNMKFSTMDADNDRKSGRCSSEDGNSGWWFNKCSAVNF